MIDQGSEITVVSKKLMKRINFISSQEDYIHNASEEITAVGGSRTRSVGRGFLTIWIKSMSKKISMEVLVMEEIGVILEPTPFVKDCFPNKKLADDYTKHREVDIIFGQDVMWRICKDEIIHSQVSDLAAQDTVFGWVPQGVKKIACHVADGSEEQRKTHLLATTRCSQEVQSEKDAHAKILNEYMSLENLGIQPTEKEEMKDVDRYALQHFNQHLQYNEKTQSYTSRLIFLPEHTPVVNNRRIAEARLRSLMRKLDADPNLKTGYFKAMAEYFEKGDAVWLEDTGTEPMHAYYLPHSGVLKDSATTAYRIVFDGSAEDPSGVSINARLCRGPQGSPDLLKLLHGFRDGEYALCGDVSRMYLAVKLAEEDQDFLRFLWFKDGKLTVARMTKITFGITDSAFQATETLCHHARLFEGKKEYENTVDYLINSRWVDDMVCSVKSEEEVRTTMAQAKEIMATASFHFRKWMSNSKKVMAETKVEDRADLKNPINFKDPNEEGRWLKTLGLKWNPISDVIAPITEMTLTKKEITTPTRRTVSSGMAQLYDPLGILTPFTVVAKILHQQVWEEVVLPKHPTKKERKDSWNAALSPAHKKKWNEWKDDVIQLQNIKIPRFVGSADRRSEELHVFCDASPLALGAVMYLLTTNEDGSKTVSFITSKCKVSPKAQRESIPRLELIAALVGARMLEHYRDCTRKHKVPAVLWTDSAISYQWLMKNHSTWVTFVARRVEEIHRLTRLDRWRHVPGVLNVADLATRGMSAKEFLEATEWLNGPRWLKDPLQWPPNHLATDEEKAEAEKEMSKKRPAKKVLAIWPSRWQKKKQDYLSKLQDQFSNYRTLVRVTAYLLRVANRNPPASIEILPHEWDEAQKFWVKKMQADVFEQEIKILAEKKELPEDTKTRRKLKKLSPYIDAEGILRVGGRLQEAEDLQHDTKHPMILPKGHQLIRRLIRYYHQKFHHSGSDYTLFHLRHNFWLMGGKREVNSALQQCVICKRWNAKTSSQIMAPLPADRVRKSRPFERIGIDFTGPFTVRDEQGNQEKTWVCLYVCLVTRALHTEVVPNLTTEQFLLTFRRLVARFGRPAVMWSDNARTFTAAAKEIGALWSPSAFKRVKKAIVADGTHWKFIAPASPHQGGVYERLVGLMKSPFKKTFAKTTYTFEQFKTNIAECEAVVNSRPLGFLSEHPNDMLPITPAMLVLGYSPSQFVDSSDLKNDPRTAGGRWKDRLKARDQFYERFLKDYLLALNEKEKWTSLQKNLKIGDVVLIQHDNLPRLVWPQAIIVEIYPGRDNNIRTVLLKTARGYVRRSIQRIIPLEISLNEPIQVHPREENVEEED